MVDDARLRRLLETRWVAALLLAVAAIVAMGAPSRLGIFSDDWTIVPRLAWQPASEAVKYAFELPYESHRPLLAVPLLLLAAALRGAGLPGAFVLLTALLAANAWLLYELTRRRLPPALALFAALLFLLHPADTTHAWLVATNMRCAMLLALSACLAYCASRPWISGVLLLLAGLIYEISPFLLLLAPWFASGGRMCDVRRSVWILASVLALVVGARVVWPDARVVGTAALWAGKASVETYFVTFGETLVLAMVKWPVRAFVRSLEAPWRSTWLVLLGLCMLPLWRLSGTLVRAPTARLRARRSPGGFAAWCDLPTWLGIEAVAWAALGTCAAAALSFAASPNFEWGHGSRINYFAAPGAALLLTTLLALAHRLSSIVPVRLAVGGVAAALVSAFLVFHISVRSEYVEAALQQKRALANMERVLGALPAGTLLVLYHPEPSATRQAASPFTARADWEARGMVHALYGPQVTGHGVWGSAELGRLEASLSRQGPGSPVVAYDFGHESVRWLRGSSQCCAPLVPVREQARAYVTRREGL